MAVTHGYCTVAELREQLGDSGDRLPTALLERAVNAASRGIDRYCHRRFWQDTAPQTRTYEPGSCDSALVDDIATKTGLAVAVDLSGLGTAFGTSWTVDVDYVLGPRNADKDGPAYSWREVRPLPGAGRWLPVRRGVATLQVTATFGWSAVPDDVAQACLIKAASLFKRKDAVFGVTGAADFGVVRIARNDPDVAGLLTPFVRPEGIA